MLTATFLALGAAVLHAGWNLVVKQSGDRWLALWGLFTAGGLIGLPYALTATISGDLGAVAWSWAVASGVVHTIYIARLARTYEIADFSVTYPIARSTGALVAALGGLTLLGDRMSVLSVIGMSIVLLGMAALSGHVQWPHVWPALVVGCLIGTYTVIDSQGARTTDGSAYAMAIFVTGGLGTTIHGVVTGRLAAMRRSVPESWRHYVLTGAASLITYWMVLLAVRRAPVGYVTALRESSVVIATFIGWRYLKERSGMRRIASSMVMAAGLVILILGR